MLNQPANLNATSSVSILIPAFNAERWIRDSIQSALAQTYASKEVIVVDDGSTDGTVETIRSFGGRVRLIESNHVGGNAARNQLLDTASGEWLQFLDADDCLRSNKIADQMNYVAGRGGNVDIVYSPVIVRKETTGRELPLEIENHSDAALHFIEWAPFCTSGLLFRRSAIREVGRWNESQPACQEHELLLRFLCAGKRFGLWNQAATIYREHGTESVSRKNPLRTIRIRMELTDRLETFLKSTNQLAPAHRRALYTARMECARSAWIVDREYSLELALRAKSTGRWWISSSPALPSHFQLATMLFGFATAERLAEIQRRVRGRVHA
jgi:glycosyltransferase involved in cell wall biosynthesis